MSYLPLKQVEEVNQLKGQKGGFTPRKDNGDRAEWCSGLCCDGGEGAQSWELAYRDLNGEAARATDCDRRGNSCVTLVI